MLQLSASRPWAVLLGVSAALGLAAPAARAQTNTPKYSNEFLNLGAGARSLGMGKTQVSLADDATAGYWNPAALTKVTPTALTAVAPVVWGSTYAVTQLWLPPDRPFFAAAARVLHGAGVPAEASGCVATAGALEHPGLVGGRTVAVVSGRNVDPAWVARVLAA